MTDIGSLALYLALALAAYAVGAGLYGGQRGRPEWVRSAEHAAYAVFGCVVVASIALLHALIIRDFNVEYVAGYTSSTLPLRYTISAFWGGQKGSLLFWTLNLAFFSAIVHLQNRDKNRELMPYVTVTLMVVALFFFLSLLLSPHRLSALPSLPGKVLTSTPSCRTTGCRSIRLRST